MIWDLLPFFQLKSAVRGINHLDQNANTSGDIYAMRTGQFPAAIEVMSQILLSCSLMVRLCFQQLTSKRNHIDIMQITPIALDFNMMSFRLVSLLVKTPSPFPIPSERRTMASLIMFSIGVSQSVDVNEVASVSSSPTRLLLIWHWLKPFVMPTHPTVAQTTGRSSSDSSTTSLTT